MQNAGAVYMTIVAGESSDQLIGVAVEDSVAMKAEIHETTTVEDGDGQSMMTMQQVSLIDVPAEGEAVLEPGGYHVMLMQLAEPLVDGDEFTVTLTFEEAGDVEVLAEVRTG
jgi:copper(I)-binding protein